MSKEELLKPRYKVIADYPRSAWRVGRIIEGYFLNDLLKSEVDMRKYPAIFKKLEWWEDRKPEELEPETWVDIKGYEGLKQMSNVYTGQSLIEKYNTMPKLIPYPGKKYSLKLADKLAASMKREIDLMDRAELEALIATCKQLTGTNCSWVTYAAKDAIISLAKSQLEWVTPISQQKKKVKSKPLNP